MTGYHVAIDHLDSESGQVTTTYYGTCTQEHVDEVRAIAALETSPRFVRDHPHVEGAFMVLRDDGDLDVYVPDGASEYRVHQPDPEPKRAKTADEPRTLSAGPAYVDGVVKFGDQSIGGAMDYPGNPPRSVWHTTESPAGDTYFNSVALYLIRVASEPQVIYDPISDKLGQFGPLTQSARALQNDNSRRTNREGKVCIQVEVLGRAASPWTNGFDPTKKPNFRKLLTAMRSHGIPDTWPAGKPLATAAAVAKSARNRSTWQSKGGHFSHGQVPGNSHWDPGAINTDIVPGKPTSAPAPSKPTPAPSRYEPFPGAGFFHGGRHSPVITAMGRRLVALGCGKYKSGPGPDWTSADKESYAAWQRHLGYTGSAADGIPGKASWDKLRVPKV